MPSTLPSSFASAAAGNGDVPSNRATREGSGYAEWTRRPNGATQTFRRSSTNNASPSPAQQRDGTNNTPATIQTAGAYVPPHLSGIRNGSMYDMRYSRVQLLDLFRDQKETSDLGEGLFDLYVGETDPSANGVPTSRWARREEHKHEVATGPEACWDRGGGIEPTGLLDLTAEEKEVFTSSVNSLVKPSNGPGPREGAPRDLASHRRASITQTHTVQQSYSAATPSTSKSTNRHRDPSESYPFPRDSQAGVTKSMRDEPAGSTQSLEVLRRKMDMKDSEPDSSVEGHDEEYGGNDYYGGGTASGTVRRKAPVPGTAGLTGPSSPWASAPQNPGFSPGAFGNFGLGNVHSSTFGSGDRQGSGALRNESRFRGLMSKGSAEDDALSMRDRAVQGVVGRSDMASLRRQPNGQLEEGLDESLADDRNRYHDGRMPYGSAALGGHDEDMEASKDYHIRHRQKFDEDATFSAFDAPSDPMNHRDAGSRQGSRRGRPFSGYDQGDVRTREPQSPTFTNPYQSPPQQVAASPLLGTHDIDPEEESMDNLHLPGLGSFQQSQGFQLGARSDSRDNNRPPPFDPRHMDRAQFPPAPATRGFPSLGGLGGLTGLGSPGPWSNNLAVGTPTRAAFTDFFAEQRARTPGEVHSPSVSQAGGNAFGAAANFGSAGPGTIGRGSKLGSLFPTPMQDQMRATDQGHPRDGDSYRQDFEVFDDSSVVGGATPYSSAPGARREVESPFRTGRGKFEDFFGTAEKAHGQAFGRAEPPFPSEQSGLGSQYSPVMHNAIQSSGQPASFPSQAQSGHRGASIGSSGSSQPPAAQQKTMVMPDRIRWIYRDPQGNTQGPWSGLEMHDWYRAGFFSPELLVKKAEDADYEPLAQLIRRIGNSREPFLVPQIGIPGPPSAQPGPNWPTQSIAVSPPSAASAAQPPFAGSFPSFGTTLTADQQNALERRKQEEQYLMARQKEHLAQQQVLAKQMQLQGPHGMHSQQLQHQQSAQSLHSQPSYGSINSPGGFQASPIQSLNHLAQGVPGSYDGTFRVGGGSGIGPIGSGVDNLGHILEEGGPGMLDRMVMSHDGQPPFTGGQGPSGLAETDEFNGNDQRIATMFNDRARLEREQAEESSSQQSREQDHRALGNKRLQEFHDLRRQIDDDESADSVEDAEFDHGAQHLGRFTKEAQSVSTKQKAARMNDTSEIKHDSHSHSLQSLSLTEQVQKAASAKQSPMPAAQSPWARVESGIIATSPPPQSASPLPAPAARRNRQYVADALAAESVSQSHSPSIETPNTASVAPWAREPTETHKQPSLREIQEIEARRAAKAEEAAAAIRRSQLERELATQPLPPAPGLPSTSTWASSESPITATAGSSAWAKPAVGKVIPAPGPATKKTVHQIIQEEEAIARKKKALAAAAASTTIPGLAAGPAQTLSSGKRYADLASKAASSAPAPTGAWLTVGAGGKAKAPPAPAGSVAPARTASSGPTATATIPARVKPVVVLAKTSLAAAQVNAQEEFRKWAVAELRPDLHKDIQVDDFVQNLLNFPPDTDLITEAVHMSSRTVDSRHFAEEFVRRRGLAEKGKIEPSVSAASSASHVNQGKAGEWSEVARKGSGSTAVQKDEGTTFKIVAAKKKTSKR